MSGIGYAYFIVLALINDGMKQSYYTIYIPGGTQENKEMELFAITSENMCVLNIVIIYRRTCFIDIFLRTRFKQNWIGFSSETHNLWLSG